MPRDHNIADEFDVWAGQPAYELMEWWVAADSLAFPNASDPVGDRRVMPAD